MHKLEIQNEAITKKGIAAIIDFYRTLSIDQLQLPGIDAFVTGVNSMFLNVVIDTRENRINTGTQIEACRNFFSKHSVPWGWFVAPGTSNNDLLQHKFTVEEEAPAMYFDLSNALPTPVRRVEIKQMDMNDDLSSWIQPVKEGFGADPDDDSFRALNAKRLKNGCEKLKHFIAYHNNNAVASGTLFISNDYVMLHNLAAKTLYTKRGFGTALTLHMMQYAKSQGIRHCYLDSSEEGFNLYHRIGFRVYSTTLIYGIDNTNT